MANRRVARASARPGPTIQRLDTAALELLRATRDADPNCPHCLDQLAVHLRQLHTVCGGDPQAPVPKPVQGNGSALINSCRALAIHLRATAWDTIGMQKIYDAGDHRHSHQAYEGASALEHAYAQQLLGSYQGAACFATSVWSLLQLNPIDRIIIGSLTKHLGQAVANINTTKLNELWRNVYNNLTTPPGPEPPTSPGRPDFRPGSF